MEVPYLEAMGTRLRELRQAAGLSQRELADLAQLRQPALSRVERGLRRTRRSTLLRLAGALAPRLPGASVPAPAAGLVLYRSDADRAAHEAHLARAPVVDLARELEGLGGPAVAGESAYLARVEARRTRRVRRRAREAALKARAEATLARHEAQRARVEQLRAGRCVACGTTRGVARITTPEGEPVHVCRSCLAQHAQAVGVDPARALRAAGLG
jgi:transcriptional regulator with XRE-family HTH domain